MIRTNFLKRLESSPRSLARTLRRVIGKMDKLLEKIRLYREGSPIVALASPGMGMFPGELLERRLPDDATDDGYATYGDDEAIEDDEDFVKDSHDRRYRLSEMDLSRWQADMETDRAMLADVLKDVDKVTPERDGKLRKIKEIIREKATNLTIDRDGNANRKTLVFTTFKDTARYLYENLTDLARELNIKIAMVSGDETHTSVGDNNFNAILTNFAPVARNRRAVDAAADIDLLIATDCISEGQNLQDCDRVINYDIHWNPIRIIQRFGRIDRIGSQSKTVRMVNCWPTEDMDAYLRLENRVRTRMALADAAATGDANPLDEDAARREIKFRDDQLLRLREEAVALEDVPTLGDFTMDYFLAQLRQYLEKNKAELEAAPIGAYAITPSKPANGDDSGVIFLLRQTNT